MIFCCTGSSSLTTHHPHVSASKPTHPASLYCVSNNTACSPESHHSKHKSEQCAEATQTARCRVSAHLRRLQHDIASTCQFVRSSFHSRSSVLPCSIARKKPLAYTAQRLLLEI